MATLKTQGAGHLRPAELSPTARQLTCHAIFQADSGTSCKIPAAFISSRHLALKMMEASSTGPATTRGAFGDVGRVGCAPVMPFVRHLKIEAKEIDHAHFRRETEGSSADCAF